MELFFENEKMDVEALEVFDWQKIGIVKDGKRTVHVSEKGWDVDTGFELHVKRIKDDASISVN